MHNFILALILAGLIHSSLGEDEFDYCETCKSIKEMRDKWPCTLCEDGIKASEWPDKISKESAPKDSDSLHDDKNIPRVVDLSREDEQEKRKEDSRRMWLYTKIIISLVLIIGSAFLCHYRYKRLKRMGAMIDYHETNMHSFPTVSHPPYSSFFRTPYSTYPPPDSSRSQYSPSDAEFPISGPPYAPSGFSNPPPNASYPSPDTRYPPPYTPYPHTLGSLSQAMKPLIMPALPPEANYRLLQGLFVPPPVSDSAQENSFPPQDCSSRSEPATASQVLCRPEIHQSPNSPNSFQQISDTAVEETVRTSADKENNSTPLNMNKSQT